MADIQLAWELAEVGARHLDATERENLFVAIGAGETFKAVESLMHAVVGNGVALRAETITRLLAWLDGYRNHPDERGLRRLIAGVNTLGELSLGSREDGERRDS